MGTGVFLFLYCVIVAACRIHLHDTYRIHCWPTAWDNITAQGHPPRDYSPWISIQKRRHRCGREAGGRPASRPAMLRAYGRGDYESVSSWRCSSRTLAGQEEFLEPQLLDHGDYEVARIGGRAASCTITAGQEVSRAAAPRPFVLEPWSVIIWNHFEIKVEFCGKNR
jgi:hypothetical protein